MLAWDRIWRAAHLAEDPTDPLTTTAEVITRARGPQASMHSEHWVLHVDDRRVGISEVDLPLLDNLDLAEVDVAVLPAYQGHGHGRRLLDHALARVATHGRHQVVLAAAEPPDGSTSRPMAFLAASGGQHALGEARRTLDVSALDTELLSALTAEASTAAAGYELVTWTGPCPEHLLADYGDLKARMNTDAPMGGIDLEAEVWDEGRIREQEEMLVLQGRVMFTAAARVGTDGPLVAFTELVTTRHDPDSVFQWNTLVVREHRGHRLGLWVKAVNLARLPEHAPAARWVHTWNALENSPMVDINERLGFRVATVEGSWRLDLPH